MLRMTVVLCCLGVALATPPFVRSREEIQAYRSYLEDTQKVKADGIRVISPLANTEENSGKFEGDIVLEDYMIEEMVEDYALGRNAHIRPSMRWPNKTVVWQYVDRQFDPLHKAAIEAGIADIERNTCVKFRYRRAHETAYVGLTGAPDGCYAHVGYVGPRFAHTLNLARSNPGVGCLTRGTIVHEWMHILGFRHMHVTYNRDDYIRVAFENVNPGSVNSFNIHSSSVVSNLGVEYDYVSCMHYHPFAFSTNGRPTMVALREHEGTIGQRQYITEKDWLRINRQYDCPGAWD